METPDFLHKPGGDRGYLAERERYDKHIDRQAVARSQAEPGNKRREQKIRDNKERENGIQVRVRAQIPPGARDERRRDSNPAEPRQDNPSDQPEDVAVEIPGDRARVGKQRDDRRLAYHLAWSHVYMPEEVVHAVKHEKAPRRVERGVQQRARMLEQKRYGKRHVFGSVGNDRFVRTRDARLALSRKLLLEGGAAVD